MSKYNVSCPSGFPEWTPAEERVYQQWMGVICDVFQKNGFMPITTPLVEREENLLAKGGNAKEMYVLQRVWDEENPSPPTPLPKGEGSKARDALRFDHTVPLALYVARHLNDISFPFKRYAIGPVLRGERAQKGRFRQFDQCDIDVIGSGELSLANDAMVAAVIIQIFERLLEGKEFVVRINNRKILTGLCEYLKIPSEKIPLLLAYIDSLEKKIEEFGENQVKGKFILGEDYYIPAGQVEFIRLFLNKRFSKIEDAFGFLKKHEATKNKIFQNGVEELEEVSSVLKSMNVNKSYFTIDLKIARGLDYYTGTVYETTLIGSEDLGSICSGGRYDDLAEVFTGKKLPGVGISIGLTRLLSKLFEAGLVNVDRSSPSDVIVIALEKKCIPKCLEIASQIRECGIATENYLEEKNIKIEKNRKQFEYADKLKIPYAIVVGNDELNKKCVQLKDMKSGKQQEILITNLERELKKL